MKSEEEKEVVEIKEINHVYLHLRNAFDELAWAAQHGTVDQYSAAVATFDRQQREVGALASKIAMKRFPQTTR